MKIKINHNSLEYSVLFFLLSLISIVVTFFADDNSGYLAISVATTIEIITFLIIHKKISGEFISFASIFFLVLALFHFGQVWICGYWGALVTKLRLRIVLKYFTDNDCIYAMRYINISFVMIGVGLLLQLTNNNIDDEYNDYPFRENSNPSYYQALAKRIIIFTFPIKMIIDIIFLLISFTVGFSAAIKWNGNFPDFIKIIGDFSMIGFALWITALADNKLKQFRVYVFIISYMVLLMISGRRSETVAYIVIITYLYFKTANRKKVRVSTLIMIGILGYLLLTFLYTTVRFRWNEGKTIEGFFSLYLELLFERNIFMESIREYGNTGYTPVCVISNWLQNYSPSSGKSYYLGLFLILPNIGGIIGTINTEAAYAIQLQKYDMVMKGFPNIGGSVIGELFFNFGITGGIIASIIVGAFLGNVSNKTSRIIKYGNLDALIYTLPIMFASLYWIRDTFGNGIREVVWGAVFCYFMTRTINNNAYKGYQ